jgi:hypothetical protein
LSQGIVDIIIPSIEAYQDKLSIMRLGSIGNIAAVLASLAVELASAVPQCASQRLQRQSEGERLVFAHFMVRNTWLAAFDSMFLT